MRVTNKLLSSNTSRSLNTSALNMSAASLKVSSGRKFSKASEDTTSAIKAFKIRRSLARVEQYQDNLNDAKDTLVETETTVMGIQELLTQAKENLISGSTGTMSDSDKQTIADIFQNLKDQVLKLGNTNFAGKYIFGGTNTTSPPFTVESGKLLYNGQDVAGSDVSEDGIYVDMGLGLSVDDSGAADSSTAFFVSTPGSVVLGTGVDENGISNNIYNLFDEISTSLKTNDMSKMELQIKKLTEKSDDVLVEVANIGERSKFVEFLNDRASSDELNLETKQSAVEDISLATANTEYVSAKTTYTASLQMSAKIMKMSLLDYL